MQWWSTGCSENYVKNSAYRMLLKKKTFIFIVIIFSFSYHIWYCDFNSYFHEFILMEYRYLFTWRRHQEEKNNEGM